MDPKRIYAIFAGTFAAVVWGVSFVATKVAIRDASPISVIWLRFTMGVGILAAAVLLRKQMSLPKRQDFFYLLGLGFIGTTLHQILQATGLETTQANTTAWIVATTPIFIAVLGWLFLKEKIGFWKAAGIFLATVGVLLVVSDGDLGNLIRGRSFSIGDGLVLLSAPNWAIFSVLSRRGLRTYPPAQMMFYVMGSGWIFNSLLWVAQGGYQEITYISWPAWIGIGFLGIFCSGLAYIFWYDALNVLPVAQTGAFIYLEPFVTAIIAALLLAEPLYGTSIAGGILILVGVWIVQVR